MSIERFAVTRYGRGRIVHAPVVRAGQWVFATGIRAVGADGLIDPKVHDASRPYASPPKPQREAQFIFKRLKEVLAAAGSDVADLVRLDQYYPDWQSVDPYHIARKEALGGVVPPSTSILVDRLLNTNAAMDVQAMAFVRASGLDATTMTPEQLRPPSESGYAPCLRAGNFVFVAGQLSRDATGNMAPEAIVPATHLWKGTRIRRETDYMIQHRLLPALEAGGSDLSLVLKAQVYLSHPEDFPAFWQSWSNGFGGRVPPTTVVPVRHPAFGSRDASIEVNLIAAHAGARARVRDIDCPVQLLGDNMLAARSLDGLLFLAGLMPLDAAGLVPAGCVEPTAPFFHNVVRAQMADILEKAQTIFAAAGASLKDVVRVLHFHADLSTFYDSYLEWEQLIGDAGLPFSAIQVNDALFVPGAALLVDLWGYIPQQERD
jgi:enamine deaminase RidA (YjgF/YER057c/UK114 family)